MSSPDQPPREEDPDAEPAAEADRPPDSQPAAGADQSPDTQPADGAAGNARGHHAQFGPASYAWPEPVADDRPSRGRGIGVPVVVGLVIGALGFGVGWAWEQFAPRFPIYKYDPTHFAYDLVPNPEPEQGIAANGLFLFIGLGAGIVLAVLCWFLLRRYRGPAMLTALALGSLLGAWTAWWTGYTIARSAFEDVARSAAVGTHLAAPLDLDLSNMDPHRWWFPGLTGVMAAQAFAAALTYTTLAGFSAYENLRGHGRAVTVASRT